MARKKYEDDDKDNHERWLVSYADFITLLFGFFVVMYALSSVNEGKYRVLSNSLLNAFGISPAVNGTEQIPHPVLPKPGPLQPRTSAMLRREREQLTRIAGDIHTVLAPLVAQGKVRVTQTDHGITVEINASVLFEPGDAKLARETSEALRAVAAVLKNDHHAIHVEGHTDSVPINNASFPSNWELSAVRASSVVRLFVDSGITESRMMAVGRGSTQPVASNETAEGRLRNRRVAVLILSSLPAEVTEVPLSTSSVK